MWDIVTIGKGDKLCTATSRFYGDNSPSDPNISENSVSYWISNVLFEDAGMTIFKRTREGKKLTELLNTNDSVRIKDYLEKLLLKKMTPAKLREFIRQTEKDHFHKGQEYAKMTIRGALGLNE